MTLKKIQGGSAQKPRVQKKARIRAETRPQEKEKLVELSPGAKRVADSFAFG